MEETEDQKKLRIKKEKHDAFFKANMKRLFDFHKKYPKEPPPVRWDESLQEWKWNLYPNRKESRNLILPKD